MLFKDILDRKSSEVREEFLSLIEKIWNRQNHVGDLLLIRENGFYSHEILDANNLDTLLSPYVIGPNHDGYSSLTHYKFIDKYRKNAIQLTSHNEYSEQFKYSKERRQEIENLSEIEEMSIQLEMLIYLKIWESDTFIRELYQTARLLSRKPYDWHFRITTLTNAQEKNLTGRREQIIRVKFRDKIKNEFPKIYALTKSAFKTQVRNAIAHSQYSIIGRYIQMNNYVKKDKYSQLKVLSFEEWTEMFHATMVLYNEMIGFKLRISEHYAEIIKETNDEIHVRITDVENKSTKFNILKYDRVWKRYYWKSNEELV
jgi:hypothetical protein